MTTTANEDETTQAQRTTPQLQPPSASTMSAMAKYFSELKKPLYYSIDQPEPIIINDDNLRTELRRVNPRLEGEIRPIEEIVNLKLKPYRGLTIIDKIGEGTFSSVYRAIDEFGFMFDNSSWAHATNMPVWFEPFDFFKDGQFDDSDRLQCSQVIHIPKRYVAIKRIYPTSSPNRQLTELDMLLILGGRHNVVPLITADRFADQVFLIMPYFDHYEFRIYMHLMEFSDIRCYMKLLFEALAHVHDRKIIHRDIKPSNFLYDFQQKKGLLVDFGLAQWEVETSEEKENEQTQKKRRINDDPSGWIDGGTRVKQSTTTSNVPKKGYHKKDSRPIMKASRAGTRGFRPPEVLLKVQKQTTKLDIWAAGVILLCLITKQFPVFNSQDDFDGLVEIACIVGEEQMKKTAEFYNRTWECNIPTIPETGVGWRCFCHRFNPSVINDIPDSLFDLLEKTLALTDVERISAKEALDHPFFQE